MAREAAVGHDHLARDPAPFLRSQKRDRRRDVDRKPEPRDRLQRDDVVVEVRVAGLERPLGPRQARRDGVDRDPVLADFRGERSRESDDTSLGAELLDEISPAEGSSMQMGDATRAGLEQAIVEPKGEPSMATAGPTVAAPRVRQVVEYGPDAMSIGMGAMSAVAVLIMLVAGFSAAAVGRGVWPAFMHTVYQQLWIYGLGALVVSLIALALGYFLGKRAA